MQGINKVILIGFLGKDPEIISFNNGSIVANTYLATGSSWKSKTTGEKKEQTEWHKVLFYGKLADIAQKYLKKGSKVYVEGSLKTRKWFDEKIGRDVYSTEIISSVIQMLDKRNDRYAPSEGSEGSEVNDNAGNVMLEDFDDDDYPF